ncbi:NAD(P)/FAD-dependent oxidoreductase [Pseudohoeflea coraliihabitans]|uniref:FAD-binding oxidoreductase n=1 Tax=Pseudohoeflea coraliihabitans TaxID=2860393 RepID=A0ABS6WJZ0_9HYPH|nr:FAD-binding oxidoreductase [Pseudohoeflea sp. DP4N28-3]MBW3096259.1 FAD-binding oxidoreductase [Pseudohoeflea sp. DP4N28-3]
MSEQMTSSSPTTAEADTSAMPQRADVVIIGGGIIGCTAGLFLAKRGLSVVICEKAHIACEQSSRNWGWVRKMGRDPSEIPLSLASARLWADLNALTGRETGFRQTGIHYLCKTAGELQKYADWLDIAQEHGIDSALLTRKQLSEALPSLTGQWEGGLFTKSDGRAEPSLATPAIAAAFRAQGGVIIEHCAVRTVETAGGAVHSVVTEQGEIRCNTVVLATGAWTRLFCGNLGIDFPQLKVNGSVLRTKPMQGPPECAVAGNDFAFRKRLDGGYTIAQKNANLAQIVPDSFRLLFQFLPAFRSEGNEIRLRFGQAFFHELAMAKCWKGDEAAPFEELRVLNPRPSERILREGLRNLSRAFPEFAGAEIAETWGCAIDVTPDAVPAIDAVRSVPGLIIASGFSGHGFGIGPGAGHLVADIASGTTPVVPLDPFRLDRF